MKNNLVESLYYIGAISTIMNYPEADKNDNYGAAQATVQLNENLAISSAFDSLGPDQFSVSDYEVDDLSVDILRGGKIAGRLRFHKEFNNSEYVSINSDSFSVSTKVRHIAEMRPSLFEKIKMNLRQFHDLTPEEIAVINAKSVEMLGWTEKELTTSMQQEASPVNKM